MIFKLLLLVLCTLVQSDVYLHNPRGSNNRLDESDRERDNNDRLFDSQNNARGGYNDGKMYYLAGSQLSIEWTNQHSCGGPNANCDIIVQYMCSNDLRDGTSTSTIPDNNKCREKDCDTDTRFGMHEDSDYYMRCKYTSRNQGLFTADQNLDGQTSQYTRQNPDGTRRGYECPEERDYYPYWRPTPWKDIVVMTNDISRCSWYKQESENVKPRFICVPPVGYMDALIRNKVKDPLGITKESCEKIEFPKNSGNKAVWQQISKETINPPDCILSPKSRDNHLGNGIGGFANTYNWTIPNDINENCALRLRYNISTGDFPTTVDSSNNTANKINIGSLVGLSNDEASKRGYVFNNKGVVVQPLKTANPKIGEKLQLKLAINTAQYGRTFQDRSHQFSIRSAPAQLSGAQIYNLNVRGKRGNIVQVYPAVEYDYVPSRLTLKASDGIHIQWTGSDTNPDNNAGQGTAGTDRSNIVLLKNQNFPEGTPGRAVPLAYAYGDYGTNYPMNLTSKSFLGFSMDDMVKLAILRSNKAGSINSELNNAGNYFDLGPRRVADSALGTYYYMCTRNNNFSNRSQKGKLIVLPKNNSAQPRVGQPNPNTKRSYTKNAQRLKHNKPFFT